MIARRSRALEDEPLPALDPVDTGRIPGFTHPVPRLPQYLSTTAVGISLAVFNNAGDKTGTNPCRRS
jgi:hypothetical protein